LVEFVSLVLLVTQLHRAESKERRARRIAHRGGSREHGAQSGELRALLVTAPTCWRGTLAASIRLSRKVLHPSSVPMRYCLDRFSTLITVEDIDLIGPIRYICLIGPD